MFTEQSKEAVGSAGAPKMRAFTPDAFLPRQELLQDAETPRGSAFSEQAD